MKTPLGSVNCFLPLESSSQQRAWKPVTLGSGAQFCGGVFLSAFHAWCYGYKLMPGNKAPKLEDNLWPTGKPVCVWYLFLLEVNGTWVLLRHKFSIICSYVWKPCLSLNLSRMTKMNYLFPYKFVSRCL